MRFKVQVQLFISPLSLYCVAVNFRSTRRPTVWMNTFNITRHFVGFVAQIYRGLGSVLQTKKLYLERDNIAFEISKPSTEDKLLLTSKQFFAQKRKV